jgi:hypothetical protein
MQTGAVIKTAAILLNIMSSFFSVSSGPLLVFFWACFEAAEANQKKSRTRPKGNNTETYRNPLQQPVANQKKYIKTFS